MKTHFQAGSAILDRYRCGLLGPHLGSFANWLSEQGYPRQTGMQKLRLFAFLSRWLEQNEINLQQLNEQRIEEFLKAQRKQLHRQRQRQHTLTQLLHHLRRLRVVPEQQPPQAENPTDRLLQDYGQFLAEERGLSEVTLDNYLPAVRRFLIHTFGTRTLRLDQLGAGTINGFILRDRSTFSPKRVQLTASALRSFLGFLYLRGQLAVPLAASVPTVATWRLSELPRSLEPGQVEQILQNCDRSGPSGRRDYAALLLLARLGLRAGELVHLCLEDINWSSGEVLVRGKSSREDRLPLPRDVGRALAMYLQKDRPPCSSLWTGRMWIWIKAC